MTRRSPAPIRLGSLEAKKNQVIKGLNAKPVTKSKKPYLLKLLWLLGAVIIAAGIGIAVDHYATENQPKTGLNQVQRVVAEVGKLYLLPKNEVPALATVTNKQKLSEPFFKNARDGDEVLIYQKNSLAIIYRPSINKIIAVGPVSIQPMSQ